MELIKFLFCICWLFTYLLWIIFPYLLITHPSPSLPVFTVFHLTNIFAQLYGRCKIKANLLKIRLACFLLHQSTHLDKNVFLKKQIWRVASVLALKMSVFQIRVLSWSSCFGSDSSLLLEGTLEGSRDGWLKQTGSCYSQWKPGLHLDQPQQLRVFVKWIRQ